MEKGSIKYYCHKCTKEVEHVIYVQDDSVNPAIDIWLCDKCFSSQLTKPRRKVDRMIEEYERKLAILKKR